MSRQTGIAVRDDDDGDDIGVNGDDYDTTQVESDADEASGASGSPLWEILVSMDRMLSEYITAWSMTAPQGAPRSCPVRQVAMGLPPRLNGAGACGPSQALCEIAGV